jgi:hypothetical protein
MFFSQTPDPAAQAPLWLRASLADLQDLDFEAPIADAKTADSRDLSQLYRAAAGTVGEVGHALFYPLSIFVVGVGSSLQTIVNVLTYVLWTSAYCVGCWRGNQCGQ